jgi:hypothetical protein
VKFQYDFLNDDYEKLPVGLRNAIEGGKGIIVLMNPPYATATENSTDEGSHKAGVSDTVIKKMMDKDKIGKSKEQLYSQFIYRIVNFNQNIQIALFCPPLLLSGDSYSGLRKYMFQKLDFKKGFLMDAKNFADVKSWGLSFSILSSKN